MSIIFDSKDSVFFVGGKGIKSGGPNPGGVTKAAWGDLDNPTLTLADVMNANGGYIGGYDFPAHFTVTNNGSGKLRIEEVAGGLFSNCIAGLIAFVSFTDTYDVGRYEVLDVDGVSGDWIDIDETHTGDTTCGCTVGGAFPSLQIASDNTDANSTTPHNVYILTNKAETLAVSIDFDTGGGDLSAGTWKRIVGVDNDGIELADGSWLTIDADGSACDVFNTDLVDNIEFRHIHAYNTSGAFSGFNFGNTASHYGFLLKECKSTDHAYAVTVQGSAVRNFFVIGGTYSASAITFYIKSIFGGSINGANLYSTGSHVIYSNYYGVSVHGCLIRSNGSSIGLRASSVNPPVVTNCAFYNVTAGISIEHTGTALVEYNNIFVVAAKATGKAINRTIGGVAYSDYSCLWAIDGAPAASDRWGGSGKPEHAIEEDPDFMDAANGNFRPRNPNVLRGGRPDIVNNVTQMGAIMQKYQFARRAKAANLGRLQIVR